MNVLAPIEYYVAVSPVPPEVHVYVNSRPLPMQAARGSVFGGLLMAQAISAASATVPADYVVDTQSSTFLRPASKPNVTYHVERLSDGRSQATRLVRAFEKGDLDAATENVVYSATISFQKHKPSAQAKTLNYAVPPPDTRGKLPENISASSGTQLVEKYRTGSLQAFKPTDAPFDWRIALLLRKETPSEFRTVAFARSAPIRNSSPSVHIAALAYMSDETMLGIALLANTQTVGMRYENVLSAVTLNHQLWFHDPTVKADEWMVVERSTSWGGQGRAIINQRVWNHATGRLVLSCTQEALVRLRQPKL